MKTLERIETLLKLMAVQNQRIEHTLGMLLVAQTRDDEPVMTGVAAGVAAGSELLIKVLSQVNAAAQGEQSAEEKALNEQLIASIKAKA